ncbi:MAG: response regulator [Candidatus Latescibacteria bacterium]|nr:response regulator [Candidatus Latescibacterota bacterium]
MNSDKKIVLVIDDQQEIRELIYVSLRGTEFEVIEASNGRGGILAAKDKKPDVILLDIMMPGFDGYMTCKVFKRNPDTKDIPVIFMTAKKEREDIKKALAAGASDYIMKPFDPSDLMTRLRRVSSLKEVKSARESTKLKIEEEDSKILEKTKTKIVESLMSFKQFGDVMVFSSGLGSMELEDCQIFRDIFANFVSDDIFKIVIDFRKIEFIDGAGLGLLISLRESLRSYGGDLRITLPQKDINVRFSFIRLIDLFHTFETIKDAIKSFQEQNKESELAVETENLNVCMSCTFVNAQKARYCSFCGTNLVFGKGEEILQILTKAITLRIVNEAQTNDINKINKARDIKADTYKIPSKFLVEVVGNDISLSYVSKKTDSLNFEKSKQIAIQAPVMGDTVLPVMIGMPLSLANPQVGQHSKYTTKISNMDLENGMIYVDYDNDAIVLHSKTNFSVAPKLPIPAKFIVPTLKQGGEIFKAKILELSRVRMIVFSEENIPIDQCMAVSFKLSDTQEISSPLVIAQHGRQKYMYTIEFKVIDGKESTRITQYMYTRQIELAKGKRT